MVQKRPFGEEELYELSYKQPRHAEPSSQLVSFLEFPFEEVAPKSYTSGGDEDKFSELKASTHKRPDSGDVAGVPFSSEKEIQPNIHVSALNSSRATSSISQEDIRSEVPFHILLSSEYFNIDPPFKVITHPKEMHGSLFSNPPRKLVPVGPDYQAELPEWGAHESLNLPSRVLESDYVDHCNEESKLAGTCIIPMPKLELSAGYEDKVGAGKRECPCEDPGSFGCVQLHIMEEREKLKEALGEEWFARLGFYDMGEVVAARWSKEEEELFHEVIFVNPSSLGKNFWNQLAIEFPSRSRKELVSYYFNVYMLRTRAKQNRFDPLNIDSDNDEWQDMDEEAVAALDADKYPVAESPVNQNYPSGNEIYEEDKPVYQNQNLEDYKNIGFGSRRVLSNVLEACPDKLINNNYSSGHCIGLLHRYHPNEVGDYHLHSKSCTVDAAGVASVDAAGVASEAPTKTDHDKQWASHFTGVSGGSGHDYVMEPTDSKEWDIGYLSYAKKKVDLLPTCSMIESVFGDGC